MVGDESNLSHNSMAEIQEIKESDESVSITTAGAQQQARDVSKESKKSKGASNRYKSGGSKQNSSNSPGVQKKETLKRKMTKKGKN